MTHIKKQVVVRVVIVVVFTLICCSDDFVQLQAANDSNGNDTQTNDSLSKKESSRDDIIIDKNKVYFSYLNDTRSDEELIQALLDDKNLKPLGVSRSDLSASSNGTDPDDNSFPPTRAPSNRLRSAGGYEAQEVAFKSPVSTYSHPTRA